MHAILNNQLLRCRTADGSLDTAALLDLVEKTYSQFDRERARSEHATSEMISELEALEEQRRLVVETLRKEHLKLDLALEHMAHGLAMFDRDQRLVVANRDYNNLLSFEGKQTDRLFSQDMERLNALIASIDAPLDDIAQLMAADVAVERAAKLTDGRVLFLSFQPVEGGGWVQVVRDITRQKRTEDQVRYMATHDALTGLSNRPVFSEAMGTTLDPARPERAAALFCIDLDHFKSVNDTLGHPVGDELLKQVALRLRQTLPDGTIVARLGGDEFAALLSPALAEEACQLLANRVIARLTQPYEVDGHNIVIGASIGFACAPVDGTDAEQIMRNADIALYKAKAGGRGMACRFVRGMEQKIIERREMENDLRRALAQSEFELFYQPQVNLRTGNIESCEALIRWNHPVRGLIPPGSFIPFAEEIGLIVEIGEWTIQEACRKASTWPSDIGIAVNVSPAQFTSPNLVPTIKAALKASGLRAERLELEITESILIADAEQAFELLQTLKEIGVRIAIDDFGTGYSSITSLRRFPFTKLKIDRSFISDLAETQEAAAIVRAIIQLASTLGITTTAEGVETEGQMDLLRALNCHEIQGYLIARPMTKERVDNLLNVPPEKIAAA